MYALSLPKWEKLALIRNGLKCACLVIAQHEKKNLFWSSMDWNVLTLSLPKLRRKNLFNHPRVFLPILLSHMPCVQFVRHVAYAMYALTRQNFNALGEHLFYWNFDVYKCPHFKARRRHVLVTCRRCVLKSLNVDVNPRAVEAWSWIGLEISSRAIEAWS